MHPLTYGSIIKSLVSHAATVNFAGEPCGNVVVEAVSHGLAVASARVGVVQDYTCLSTPMGT